MSTNVVKVDPKEFGLDEKQVATIEQAFLPKIKERNGLIEIYDKIIKSEITPELCKEAKEIRNKLVKVRTGIAEIHKTQKAFFLSAGRFVDAWKNKETLPVEQMEDNLEKIENYFVNIEKQRIADLELARIEEVKQYSEVIPSQLGLMQDDVYSNYLSGLKIAHEAKIEAEKQAELLRIETDRKEKLNIERKNKTIRLVEFIENYENLFFGDMSEDEFMKIVNEAIEKRTAKEVEQVKIKAENERLQKEAEKKQAELEAERKKQAEILEAQRKEAEKKQAEKDAENAKLQAQLKAKEDAERKVREEAEKKEREQKEAEAKASKAPRKEKLTKWVDSFFITEFPNDEIATEILNKFNAFKNWAKTEIEKL